MIEAWLAQSV